MDDTQEAGPFPSFRALHGYDPVPGVDYDPDGELCQDDAEYLFGFGRYSDTVCTPEMQQRDTRIMRMIERTDNEWTLNRYYCASWRLTAPTAKLSTGENPLLQSRAK